MKSFLATLALIAAVSLLPSVVHAQVPAQPTQPAPAKVETPPSGREVALQAEVQVLKEFTQHILSTVYFALATVVVVLVAMLGFGWYQHARVTEREKETLRNELNAALKAGLERGTDDIRQTLHKEVLEVDRKFASTLGLAFKRITELRISTTADVFRSTHSAKTPETDFEVLTQVIRSGIGSADPESLKHALSVLTEHLEEQSRNLSQTSLLELARELPPECGAFAERIRELLSRQKGGRA